MVRRILLAVVVSSLALTASAMADTLIIDGLDRNRMTASERPSRGMTMTKVESTWGQPTTKRGAVGDPPIARWEYPGFVVYFEYSHVIHSVQTR